MWNKPNEKMLAKIPRLYATESIATDDKPIYLHFFIGGCDWYIAEFDGEDTFFGFAKLNDSTNAEWGYISFGEIKRLRRDWLEVDRERNWKIRKFKEAFKG